MLPPRFLSSPLALTLLVLSACASLQEGEDDDSSPVDDPSPYIYDDTSEAQEPSLDATEIASGLASALETALALNLDPIFTGYHEAIVGADGDCPFSYAEEEQGYTIDYWYDECQANSGTTFSGYAAHVSYQDYQPEADGYSFTGEELYLLGGEIRTEDGTVYRGSGDAQSLHGTTDDSVLNYKVVGGTFAWDGDAAEGSWMESELSPFFTIGAIWFPAYEARYVQLGGGIGGLEGVFDTVSMSGNLIYDEILGSSCDQELSGTVSVREPGGNWYDVVFDGPSGEEGDETPAELCDGCGEAWYRGQLVGQVCADFTALLNWEDSPW